MKFLPKLFANNRAWAEKIKLEDPRYFQRLSQTQTPEYLWIGCADSRGAAQQNVRPGAGGPFRAPEYRESGASVGRQCSIGAAICGGSAASKTHHCLRPLWLWRGACCAWRLVGLAAGELVGLCARCISG